MHSVNLGVILEEIAVLVAYEAVQVAVFAPQLGAPTLDALDPLAHIAVADTPVIVLASGRRD